MRQSRNEEIKIVFLKNMNQDELFRNIDTKTNKIWNYKNQNGPKWKKTNLHKLFEITWTKIVFKHVSVLSISILFILMDVFLKCQFFDPYKF